MSNARADADARLYPETARLGPESPTRLATRQHSAGIISLSDIVPERVSWLWHPYIPAGKLTLLDGDPGVGKSFLSTALAAAVSTGATLPGCEPRDPGGVLLLTAEDGLADTVRPRLDCLGADTERIHALEYPLYLEGRGLALFEAALTRLRPTLVIIDPLVAFMGPGVDLHRANETRALMARLASVAGTYGCAILCVRHLTKTGRDRAIYRGIGSIDLTAACRSVLLAGCDPDNPALRALVQIKNNLAQMGPARGYAISDGVFRWTGSSSLTANRILGPAAQPPSVRDQAVAFLESCLGEGPLPQKEVQCRAAEAGISWDSLKRAKLALGIESRRRGEPGRRGGGAWSWELPKIGLEEQVSSVGELLPLIPDDDGGHGGPDALAWEEVTA